MFLISAAEMADEGAGNVGAVSGGNKPVHRFLRGQPKSLGVVLIITGVCMLVFGIQMRVTSSVASSAETYSPYWLGTLFFTCGLLYVLSERKPSKKIITASLALSILTTIGVISACSDFIKSISSLNRVYWYDVGYNISELDWHYHDQHLSGIEAMEYVFIAHSLMGGALLVTMSFFSRAALKSSNTQAIVVMRNLPSAES
ncbi:hypothetical protein DNTS_021764 [Danionella cerebrum]|uniref:Uncharacterized protein n=1 Tax=Danionella cerebrum TaxID=2873325 RepID=A0A553QPA7_9TELE|nr:hypothetical protein DNTS_021764 [Danionella translucida]